MHTCAIPTFGVGVLRRCRCISRFLGWLLLRIGHRQAGSRTTGLGLLFSGRDADAVRADRSRAGSYVAWHGCRACRGVGREFRTQRGTP
jgi:hypothetical protein